MTKLDTSKTEWDLSPLLAGDDDPKIEEYRKAVTEKVDAFVEKWRDRDDYLKDPKVLREALDEYERLHAMPGLAYDDLYFHLRTRVETQNKDLTAKLQLAEDFALSIWNKMQFFSLKIGQIPEDVQKSLLRADELKTYYHWLDKVFRAARYKLSEKEEAILNLTSTASYSNWVKMLQRFISKEERKVLFADGSTGKANWEMLSSLAGDDSVKVRQAAKVAIEDIQNKYVDVAEAELNSVLQNQKVGDELRGHKRPDQHRHMNDDIDSDVVDAVVKTVESRNDLSRRFFDLKAKLHKVDHLAYSERAVGYGEATAEYPYDQAANLVGEVFQELDPDFYDIYSNMLATGRVDALARKNKSGGAFCISIGPQHPVYVMLNHTNTMRDVATIAHEMGHAIHSTLSIRAQNALNCDYPTSVAEVASTFMEDFIYQRLLEEADEETELSLRVGLLNDLIASCHRQIACYQFEQDIHQGYRQKGYLSKDEINDLFNARMEGYLGKHAEGSDNFWVAWPHIRNYFYVYSYASGILISKALQSKVKKDKAFISKVKEFLSAGSSKSPKEIFADMGIDITDKAFWQEGLKEIEQQLDETEKLAKKLGKI
ncbi:hypothetical protein EPO04_00630 [Patescibacteria group bacterium]|nr:MAG: hypothetical protein EPO04_00630 [Patescibacteria group bacterium]